MTECLRCGKCCMELGQETMIVDRDDVARWIREERCDILLLIDPCINVNSGYTVYGSCPDLVIDTHKQCENCCGGDIANSNGGSWRCVFLRKVRGKTHYECKIQETKPNHCKAWKVGKWKNCAALKEKEINAKRSLLGEVMFKSNIHEK